MGKAIGIDYGTKRVGIAISDELGMIATPLRTIHSKDVYAELDILISADKVSAIVVGVPFDLKGNVTDATAICQNFVKSLRRKYRDIEIYEVDERFTSRMAADTLLRAGAGQKLRRDKSMLDKISAAILLQSFLDGLKR